MAFNDEFSFDEDVKTEPELDDTFEDGSTNNNDIFSDVQVNIPETTQSKEQVKTVDPSKSKKLKERKEKVAQGKASKTTGKKTLPKKAKIGIAVGAVIALMFIVKALMGMGDKNNFYTVMDAIVRNDLGSFKYEFDVRTTEHTGMEISGVNVTMADLENAESVESVETEEAETGKHSNTFVNWSNSDGIEVTSWQYPKYKLTIDGVVTNMNPYTAEIVVSLATEHYNDVLTTLYAVDTNYYIDIEQLGKWLRNSGDSYFMKLGLDIPEGSKYLAVPASEFKLYSRYAEDAELELSNVSGIEVLAKRLQLLETLIEDPIKETLSSDCISGDDTKYTLNVTGEEAQKVVNGIKSILTSSSAFYRNYLNVAESQGLYTADQKKQAMREEDNVLQAINNAMIYLNTEDLSIIDLNMSGTARKYTNASNNDALEASVKASFKTESKDYVVVVNMERTGNAKEIVIPDGSTLSTDSLKNPLLVQNTINGVLDYLNPTSIQLEHKMELNPKMVQDTVKQSLINLVNNTPAAEMYLTQLTVDEYIDKYKNFNRENATTSDKINTQIVADFLAVIADITDLSGVVVSTTEDTTVAEAEVEQFPEFVYEDVNLKITGRINKEKTDSNLSVLDILVMNKSDGNVTLDLTNFSLRTLLSSVYPSNNMTLLRNYDNSWNEMLTPAETLLQPKGFSELSLYFVTSDDTGYMDLWYGETKLGVVIEY